MKLTARLTTRRRAIDDRLATAVTTAAVARAADAAADDRPAPVVATALRSGG